MNPERWRRIDEIFHAVLEREPSERSEFLVEACEGDDVLRSEIEGLLAAHEKESTFFENPAADIAAKLLAEQGAYQASIAHYRILKKIGSGGMGDVYLAEDSRLNRKVALKLLPTEFTQDKERIRRFEREARSVSALNHPNILTIHDIGQIDSSTFIVSEYIDGETLRQRIRISKMQLKEILSIAVQSAEALDAAHQAGIIHRDIKPENIMLRRDGYVKVLDFGLAKLAETRSSPAVSDVNTQTSPDTRPGIIVGTVKYMSPEQARGLSVVTRTDIFSLGVVLYEMIAQRSPFDGATSSDVLAAILEKHPPALRTYGDFPEELQWIITKALAKDVEERYQTSKEFLTDLKRVRKQIEISEELKRSSGERAEPRKTHFLKSKWLLISAGIVVFLTAATIMIAKFAFKKEISQISVPVYRQITFEGDVAESALSPDGKYIAYSSNNGLFVQELSGGRPVHVYNSVANEIRWSPDSSKLSFNNPIEGLIVVPKLGGTAQEMQTVGRSCWSPDGVELAYWYLQHDPKTNLKRAIQFANLSTGTRRHILLPGSFTWLANVDWSRKGRLVYEIQDETKNTDEIWTILPDGPRSAENSFSKTWYYRVTTVECAGRFKFITFSGHRIQQTCLKFGSILKMESESQIPKRSFLI